MPYLEQMNYQSNRFFVAEGRIAGRDAPVKEKITSTGNVSIAFMLNVGYCKIFDPEGEIENEKGQKFSQNWHTIYCKIYADNDRSNKWQVEEARNLILREHVVVFGKVYEKKSIDPDGNEVPFLEYRVDSILFPERMASMLVNGNTIDLSEIHTPDYTPGGAGGPTSAADKNDEMGEYAF